MKIDLIDVSEWRLDSEHRIFPFGARDKKMLWSPAEPPDGIKPNWPYLFKLSRKIYPDQYWMEVVAYIVGSHLKVDVPKAFPAVMYQNQECKEGALLEWFYDVSEERFIHASDYFKRVVTNFDNDKGKQHNIVDLIKICRMTVGKKFNWREWLEDMLIFDSLIGNTDRHQENWGIVFERVMEGLDRNVRLSAFFDNGTSLGHEHFPERVNDWTLIKTYSYLIKGKHHLRHTQDDFENRVSHLDSIVKISKNTHNRGRLCGMLNLDVCRMNQEIDRLCTIETSVKFSPERSKSIKHLIFRRLNLIKLVLEMRKIEHVIKPNSLWLTWQPNPGASRYLVGQFKSINGLVTFEYRTETSEFKKAQEKGFVGFPSFKINREVYEDRVLEPFLRRLPPKSRTDFEEYLQSHMLPSNIKGNDLSLLAHTGAKFPGDGFCILPDLSSFNGKFEYLLEVAGTRYRDKADFESISVGEPVDFVPEPENEYDENAIKIFHKAGHIGYVNRVLCEPLLQKIKKKKLVASIAKISKIDENYSIYILLEVDD